MRKFQVKFDDNVYEVEVEEITDIQESKQIEKPVKKPEPTTSSKAEVKTKPESISGEQIKAPLPGTISLEVSEGDQVGKGDVLFVLEAMKMENEITAPVAGTVKGLYVNDGASVDTGDLLAVIG